MSEEKDRILEHAKEKFFRDGVSTTTMDELASDLHISKKTIYKFFPSKDAIIDEIMEFIMSMVKRKFESVLKSEENAVIKIYRITSFITDFSLRIGNRWLREMKKIGGDRWKKIDTFRTKMISKNLQQIMDQGKKEGLIIDRPNFIMITIVVSSIQSVVNPDFMLEHDLAPGDAAKMTFELLFRGIFTEKGRKVFKQYNKDFCDD